MLRLVVSIVGLHRDGLRPVKVPVIGMAVPPAQGGVSM